MIVGYRYDSKRLWMLWDPEFPKIKAQSKIIFNKESNADISCSYGWNEIDIFELREDEVCVEETNT
jgi:hypothetical protein